jgi:uncharacterized HhH-GPD family protein
MNNRIPNWRLIEIAAIALTKKSIVPFTRKQLIYSVQAEYPDRLASSLNPMIQAITVNLKGGAPGGTNKNILRSVSRGKFVLLKKMPEIISSQKPASHFPKNDESRQLVAKAILKYGQNENIYLGKEFIFTPNKKADDLIRNNSFAFLIGVILDQGQKAERVWATPLELMKRLGHIDPNEVAKINIEELSRVFGIKPKLHRFWKTMAKRVYEAANIIANKYRGDAAKLWDDIPRTEDLQNRFRQFNGIGQKKASMAANILARDLKIPVKNLAGVDISNDVHIRRVFHRTGLADDESETSIVQAARNLNPEYPGELDLPTWDIGRKWCHPNNPICEECPLNNLCQL